MEPLPESRDVASELAAEGGDALLADLLARAERVQELVPTCVGVTLTVMRENVTLTVVSTTGDGARLDAVQYLDDGPCREGARRAERLELGPEDLVDEERWLLFAQVTAERDVASTLTLPLLDTGTVVGSVNLYASAPHAFAEHQASVADIFGAWAAGAVTNADLSFETRRAAQRAPQTLREERVVDQAVGALISVTGADASTVRSWIEDAAAQADITPVELAVEVVAALRRRQE